MKLDYRVRKLIALGTAVGANCLEYHVGKARERGISEDEIAEAIDVGKAVRQGAQDKLASDLDDALAPLGCGCDA
jgi:AhpD family alkylhydroperoxidase